ncbi:dehydrogenase [Raoultella ornithinolytica]|nr:dehydrogenase [Raoultella ornithinolytica]
MDLGIGGKQAFVCASSQGLGLACAAALAAEGVNVTLNGRYEQKLAQAASALRQRFPQVAVTTVTADLTQSAGRAAILAAWPKNRHSGDQ